MGSEDKVIEEKKAQLAKLPAKEACELQPLKDVAAVARAQTQVAEKHQKNIAKKAEEAAKLEDEKAKRIEQLAVEEENALQEYKARPEAVRKRHALRQPPCSIPK